MKKGKVLTKSHITLVAMVLLLGAAVWLNTNYNGKTKYMGEATFVSTTDDQNKAPVSAEITPTDYFTAALAERENAYKQAEEALKVALDNPNASSAEKSAAIKTNAALAERRVGETAVENILKAKGFSNVLVTISGNSATVAVDAPSLSSGETLQIQDAVTTNCGISLSNIKIITVNS